MEVSIHLFMASSMTINFESKPHFFRRSICVLGWVLLTVLATDTTLGQDTAAGDGDHVAEIEAAKQSLSQINAAINQGDFGKAAPYMTEQGANELALWVASFAVMLNDPQISAGYPEEFDAIRQSSKAPIEKYGLDFDLKSLSSNEEATGKILEALDKDKKRWEIVDELWSFAKESPMEMVLIRGAVMNSNFSEDTAYLIVARQAPGDAKKYDAAAPPSVAQFVKEDNVWKFDGLDADKTLIVERAHARKMEAMPPPLADPNFEAKTLEGTDVSYEDYAGKVLVIDFWGTWCSPCVENLPKLAKIRDAFAPHGFEVVGIALDEPEELAAYLKDSPLPWVNVSDDGKLKTQFGVKVYPTLFVINQDGKHVASNLESAELIDQLVELLALKAGDFEELKKEVAAIAGGH